MGDKGGVLAKGGKKRAIGNGKEFYMDCRSYRGLAMATRATTFLLRRMLDNLALLILISQIGVVGILTKLR